MTDETYGQMVKRLREERGWSQQELAEVSGLSKRGIQYVEANTGTQGPQPGTRLRIDRAFGRAAPLRENPFADYPDTIQAMLLTVGAWLMTRDEEQRMDWFRDFLRSVGLS